MPAWVAGVYEKKNYITVFRNWPLDNFLTYVMIQYEEHASIITAKRKSFM